GRIEPQPAPTQPLDHGTGHGILGVLPVRSNTAAALAYADPVPRPSAPTSAPTVAAAPAPEAAAAPVRVAPGTRPMLRAGTWIVQVGALESEAEANKRLSEARASATAVLARAEPFTEA